MGSQRVRHDWATLTSLRWKSGSASLSKYAREIKNYVFRPKPPDSKIQLKFSVSLSSKAKLEIPALSLSSLSLEYQLYCRLMEHSQERGFHGKWALHAKNISKHWITELSDNSPSSNSFDLCMLSCRLCFNEGFWKMNHKNSTKL